VFETGVSLILGHSVQETNDKLCACIYLLVYKINNCHIELVLSGFKDTVYWWCLLVIG